MRLSKFFYLMSFYGGWAGFLIMGGVGVAVIAIGESQGEDALTLVGAMAVMIALALALYAAVVMLVFIYKMWDAIQPARPRMTPGKAVGFLFIPFFNFYWVFMVWHGFAQDFNAYAQRNRLPAPPAPENLALALSILTVCSAVPYLGALPALANLALIGILVSNICDSVNALPESGTMPSAPAGYWHPPGGGYPPPGSGYPPPGSGYPPAGSGYPPTGGPNLPGGPAV